MGMAGATTQKPVFEENCALGGARGRRTCRGHQVIPFSRCSRTVVARVSLNQSIGSNTRPFYESTSAIISIYLHLPHIKHLPHICRNIWPSSRLCSTRRRLTVNLSLHPPLAREKSQVLPLRASRVSKMSNPLISSFASAAAGATSTPSTNRREGPSANDW